MKDNKKNVLKDFKKHMEAAMEEFFKEAQETEDVCDTPVSEEPEEEEGKGFFDIFMEFIDSTTLGGVIRDSKKTEEPKPTKDVDDEKASIIILYK